MLLLFAPVLLSQAGNAAHQPTAAAATVHIDNTQLTARTSTHFKCWNIDASPNRGFLWRNLSTPNLLQLAQGLPAGHLRFGGSGNDALWYGGGIGSDSSCEGAVPRHFNCLNATMVCERSLAFPLAFPQLYFLAAGTAPCSNHIQTHCALFSAIDYQ